MITENFGKCGKLSIFKIHKKICHKQNVKCLVFFQSTRQVFNHLYLNLIKGALKTLIFFKNLIFVFLNPKIANG